MAPYFGDLCLERTKITGRQMRECLQMQIALRRTGKRRRLGEILVDRAYLDQQTVDSLLQEQRSRGLFAHPEIPGYRLEERLGYGAMAQVYRATQLSVSRDVAVKILNWKLRSQTEAIARFLREVRASAKLNHPHIVQAIDSGHVEETYYFVMEYVDGLTLHQLLVLYRSISEHTALRIAYQVADALCHLELHNMVHRDLKPTNLLLQGEIVKICDLGLAREVYGGTDATTMTDQGAVVGTPDYFAPEQARGERDLDIRTDLYALGSILYRMVTGQLPYVADSPTALFYMKSYEDIVPPEHYCPDISAETADLIRKLMARNREDRYPAAKDALEAIKRCARSLSASGIAGAWQALAAPAEQEAGDSTSSLTRSPGEIRPKLVLTTGAMAGRRVPIVRNEITVGRQSQSDLCIREPWFSRRHFSIRKDDQQWVVKDLNSRNGISVNGERVSERALHHGDEIAVKGTKMIFLLEYPAPGEPPGASTDAETKVDPGSATPPRTQEPSRRDGTTQRSKGET
jgi:serine/threonine protein kinase